MSIFGLGSSGLSHDSLIACSRYGGPNTQLVTEEYRIGWSTYLGSTENVIYASIDGRGSLGRGLRFLHATYKQLGQLEVQDQIAGAK